MLQAAVEVLQAAVELHKAALEVHKAAVEVHKAAVTGGAPGQDPTPKGGGGGGLYGPQNCRTEQGALSAPEAPEILF